MKQKHKVQSTKHKSRRPRSLCALNFALCAFAFLSGCLERTVTITSNPPGALISLNDTEIGRTPVEASFTYYGDYDVRARREGHEPVATHQKLRAPFYEWPPIDLIATALPFTIHTRKHIHLELAPVPPLDDAAERALIERARELRSRAAP